MFAFEFLNLRLVNVWHIDYVKGIIEEGSVVVSAIYNWDTISDFCETKACCLWIYCESYVDKEFMCVIFGASKPDIVESLFLCEYCEDNISGCFDVIWRV